MIIKKLMSSQLVRSQNTRLAWPCLILVNNILQQIVRLSDHPVIKIWQRKSTAPFSIEFWS